MHYVRVYMYIFVYAVETYYVYIGIQYIDCCIVEMSVIKV